MGEDLSLAVKQLAARAGAGVRAVVLRGAGVHFSPGGNPHAWDAKGALLTAAAAALRRTFAGFAALRALAVPLVCAVHGTVVGGGNAACLSCDYVVAEASATFEHGNLVRGVCPLGGYSRTPPDPVETRQWRPLCLRGCPCLSPRLLSDLWPPSLVHRAALPPSAAA